MFLLFVLYFGRFLPYILFYLNVTSQRKQNKTIHLKSNKPKVNKLRHVCLHPTRWLYTCIIWMHRQNLGYPPAGPGGKLFNSFDKILVKMEIFPPKNWGETSQIKKVETTTNSNSNSSNFHIKRTECNKPCLFLATKKTPPSLYPKGCCLGYIIQIPCHRCILQPRLPRNPPRTKAKEGASERICWCGQNALKSELFYLGLSPLPVTVTTRIITFLVYRGSIYYKPSFATVTGRGGNPSFIFL